MAYPFIASYFLQRYSKSSAEQSNLFEIVMPRCSVSYVEMQIECRTIKLVWNCYADLHYLCPHI